MLSKVNPTLIGGFVLASLVLGLSAVFLLSNGALSHQATRFILFFESDVKGLQVGSPVNFRGVKIGQVESMSITYFQESQAFRIPVIIGIDDSRVGIDGVQTSSGGLIGLEELIRQGLRARLNLQSLVTGKLEIELDFHPQTPIRLVSTNQDYPEIPTIQSSMEKIATALEAIPIERITQRLSEILDGIDKMMANGEPKQLMASLIQSTGRLERVSQQLLQATPNLLKRSADTLADTQRLLDELTQAAIHSQAIIASTEVRLEKAFASWERTMASGDEAFAKLGQAGVSADEIMQRDSPLMSEMTAALRELGAAARSIRIMSEYLERHPEALLRGKQ
ncbi:MAG: MCE family protein [Candidatus Thiodiazotropha sp. (ex Dulcina madagascariensis)]|nr:MCE family protein [Candidatus Thiodiazotropha sp. (ex Dulcina madagascariensis)]